MGVTPKEGSKEVELKVVETIEHRIEEGLTLKVDWQGYCYYWEAAILTKQEDLANRSPITSALGLLVHTFTTKQGEEL